MIHLKDDYYLDFDKHNYILCEKKVVKKEGSKNLGKEYIEQILFSGRFKNFVRSYAEHVVKKKAYDESLKSLNDIQKEFEESVNSISSKQEEIIQELRNRLGE
jgi:CRISPR/Cas system-associated protein Cas5 (RAMP superfamily)